MGKRTKKDIYYVIKTIVFPIMGIVFFSCLLGRYLVDIPKTIAETLHLNFADMPVLSTSWLKVAVLCFLFLFVYRFFVTKDRIFADGINGKYPMFVYLVSRILGYKTVSLIHMPVPLQFRLLNSRMYMLYEPKAEDYDEKYIDYIVEEENKENTSMLNIVVLDTYQNEGAILPNAIEKYKTIIIARKDTTLQGQRIFSKNLMKEVQNVINANKQIKDYNLLLYTNPYTNIKLYKDVFNTGNDLRRLNLYYADDITHRFCDKKETISC